MEAKRHNLKLEVEFSSVHRIYANATWKLDGDKLIQTLEERIFSCPRCGFQSLEKYKVCPKCGYSFLSPPDPTEFTLNPGDNIRIDGDVYHVVSHERAYEQKKDVRVFHFVFRIEKGRYTPPEWIEIGKIERKEN